MAKEPKKRGEKLGEVVGRRRPIIGSVFIFVAFINLTPESFAISLVIVEYKASGFIISGLPCNILLLSVSLINPISNGLTPYNANILLTFGKFCSDVTALLSHNIFLPEFI